MLSSPAAARTVLTRGAASLFPIRVWTARSVNIRTKTTVTASSSAAVASAVTTVSATIGTAARSSLSGGMGKAAPLFSFHIIRAASFSADASSSSPSPSADAAMAAGATFSPYQYPTRTEAPEITTSKATTAAVLRDEDDATTTTGHDSSQSSPPTKLYAANDPFDDGRNLTREERNRIKVDHMTKMSSSWTPLNSLPIQSTIPPFIPPNVASQDLDVPETLITTLPNGIRVVSQETYSQMCTVGVLTNVGSRHEEVTGTIHLLETMAFGPTTKYDGLEINQLLQDWGASRFVSHSREQSLHCVDILRPNVERGVDLLAQTVLEPRMVTSPAEVEHAKEVMAFQAQEHVPGLALGEALQVAAYGPDQQLGKLHFGTPESIPLLNADLVEDFYVANVKNNPGGMVVAGAGIAHNELVELAQHHFGAMVQRSAPTTVPSVYRGGSHFIEKPEIPSVYGSTLPEEEQCRVAIAFPVGGWHTDSMVTACVLQTLLGGGSSFSAGGPGKGMYSRMYQQVLNRYGWMETAEAFTTFADEGGLFGVSASTASEGKVDELVNVLANQLYQLSKKPVGDVELSRARNMLRCNVLTQLESRLVLFEDMGRQVLTYGKREDAAATCRKIEQVTAEDIQRLVQDMLKSPPTLAATGVHLEKVAGYEDVSRLFR